MTVSILAAALAAASLQAAPAVPAPAAPPANSLDALPPAQIAAPRCAIAFALVGKWQKAGDERGASHPDIEAAGGREFFVRAMAALMDATGKSRGDVIETVRIELEMLEGESGEGMVNSMMPACLTMLEGARLEGPAE